MNQDFRQIFYFIIVMNRIIVYPKDHSILMGCHIKSAFRVFKPLRTKLKRNPTIREYCEYFKLPIEDIEKQIN